MEGKKDVNVLFVCMGNICRSPTAEGVFRKLVSDQGLADAIRIDSAGTHAYHVGASPDARAQQAANKRGIDLSDLRGRQVGIEDFAEFEYILVMDCDNLANVEALRESADDAHVSLFLDFAKNSNATEVPDPYYGGASGFEHVLDLIEDASNGLLEHIRKNHLG